MTGSHLDVSISDGGADFSNNLQHLIAYNELLLLYWCRVYILTVGARIRLFLGIVYGADSSRATKSYNLLDCGISLVFQYPDPTAAPRGARIMLRSSKRVSPKDYERPG